MRRWRRRNVIRWPSISAVCRHRRACRGEPLDPIVTFCDFARLMGAKLDENPVSGAAGDFAFDGSMICAPRSVEGRRADAIRCGAVIWAPNAARAAASSASPLKAQTNSSAEPSRCRASMSARRNSAEACDFRDRRASDLARHARRRRARPHPYVSTLARDDE